MEACDLCGVTGYELIDNLCIDCNPDSHEHERQKEEEQLDEQLWKE